MKKLIAPIARLLSTALILLAFSGCLKDKMLKTYTYLEPVFKDKAEVLANIRLSHPQDLKTTGKIYISGRYIFLNEVNKGVHVIDNINPGKPSQIGFIEIPGNLDIAVKGNTLYADLYADLVAIDITKPAEAKLTKVIAGVFPERGYLSAGSNEPNKILVDWVEKTVTLAEGTVFQNPNQNTGGGVTWNDAAAAFSPAMGGSMASFAVVNDYLYAVDRHSLKTVSLKNVNDPVLISDMFAGFDIETIYPLGDKLFLGSMGGLFIYDISNPVTPQAMGTFQHARACDPVVADGNYAFVTLREGTDCGPTEDELLIVNISNLNSPSLFKTYPMSNPHGLAKDNNLLFICDGTDGLKVYDASTLNNLQLIEKIDDIETYDIIAFNKRAIVVATDGLYQYDYSDPSHLKLLSKIRISH